MTSLALLTDFALHFPPAIPDLLHGPLYAALRRAGFLRLVSDLVFLTTCHALAILTSSTCAHLLSPLQGNSRAEFEFRIVLSLIAPQTICPGNGGEIRAGLTEQLACLQKWLAPSELVWPASSHLYC